MDQRLKEIMDDFENRKIGLDDKFHFHCIGCGKCCKYREDILLTPRDIFRMSQYLNLEVNEFLEKYCEGYVGSDSRIVIFRLKPVGKNKICPLHDGRLCKVHEVKPVVCALYPLGRYISVKAENGTPAPMEPDSVLEVGYLNNPHGCRTNRTYTVRNWLERFGVPVNDTFFISWTQLVNQVGGEIRKAEEETKDALVEASREAFLYFAYLKYDLSKEFSEQWEQNSSDLCIALSDIKKEYETLSKMTPEELIKRIADGV